MAEHTALDELKKRLDSLRPIDQEKLQAVQEKFRLEWTYHSNALEGNPLTLGETSFFIREGLTSKGKPLSAYLEATNHIAALDYLEKVVHEKADITPFLIREYHSMLFKRIDQIVLGIGAEKRETAIKGGEYKQENNHVIRLDGKILEFTEHFKVPMAVEELTEWYRTEAGKLHPVEQAAIFHHRLVAIHPFLDGNGRVSRLLMNTIFMQNGFTPAIIPVEEKQRYLEALQAADDGDMTRLIAFIEEQVGKTLQVTTDVVEGREAFDFKDLSRLVKNIVERTRSIEQDLGHAVLTPEERSSMTANKIRERLLVMLNDHVKEVQSSMSFSIVNFSLQPNSPVPDGLVQQMQGFGLNLRGFSARFQMNGTKRFQPNGYVDFAVFAGRFQVAVGATTTLGTFNPQNAEQFSSRDDLTTSKTGSIYEDEWDWEALKTWVIEVFKRFYQAWDKEMERRKQLIAAEEADVEKQRFR